MDAKEEDTGVKESYLDDAIDPSLVKRALVIKLRHFGDVLLTSPVFGVLAEQIPAIEIDALVYAETAPMLEEHPAVARVFGIDRRWKQQGLKSQWRHERALLKELRQRHYDLVIHLTEHVRGARLARQLKPRYAVARRYHRKRGNWWRRSFTHTYRVPEQPRHTVEVHLDALRRLGIYPQQEQRGLALVAGNSAESKVAKLLALNGLESGSYLLLHPTSRWMFKGWTRHGFSEVMASLHDTGHKLVLTSSPDIAEMKVVEHILSELVDVPVVNLAGQLDLKELAALIDHARCFIGLDSVPMHMAAAVNTPCVALFGPSDERVWGPWQVKHRVLSSSYSCRPCGLDGCGNGKVSDCLMAIEPSMVLDAVAQVLDSRP